MSIYRSDRLSNKPNSGIRCLYALLIHTTCYFCRCPILTTCHIGPACQLMGHSIFCHEGITTVVMCASLPGYCDTTTHGTEAQVVCGELSGTLGREYEGNQV